MKVYSVGGSVRDTLIGLKPKDLDYVVVLDNLTLTVAEGFKIMEEWMVEQGFTIFLSTPEMLTSRAKFPKGSKNEGLTGDFVLARHEVSYIEGTRRPVLELGTIFQDLERRDFTVNAMAQDENGNIIDPFNGQQDLKDKILKTPLPAIQTFNDDALRVLRALRFSITKDFEIDSSIKIDMFEDSVLEKLRLTVSAERVREEVMKMMKHDTVKTIKAFSNIEKYWKEDFTDIIFSRGLWLKPTFEI